MAKTRPGPRRQRHWGALIIVLAGLIGFGLAIWARQAAFPRPTPLEEKIAENAPAENVQSLAVAANGDLLVGTTQGVLQGRGKTWNRLPGLNMAVRGMAPGPDGSLLIGGQGIARYAQGQLAPVAADPVEGLVSDGAGRLLRLRQGSLVEASTDVGKSWSQAAAFLGGDRILAIAASGPRVMVGSLQGLVSVSPDGGTNWESHPGPGGSVTALLFDPSKAGRRWACAGGAVYYSDDDGNTWRRPTKKLADRPLIALGPAPSGEQGIRGITADGLLVTIVE